MQKENLHHSQITLFMADLVTIIIPCYNAEKYLKEAVGSVLNQTHKNWELILVDDFSTDGTSRIILEFQNRYPKQIFSAKTKGKGACDARNTGLELAKGDYVQFLDADDLITPEKIDEQLKGFSENIDVVFSDIRIEMFEDARLIEIQTFQDFIQDPFYIIIRKVIASGNPLYRKDVVQKNGGYNSGLESAQDWDFHIRLFLSGTRFYYLPGKFFIIRKTSGSVSSNWIKVYETASRHLPSLKYQIRKSNHFSDKIGDYLASIYYLTLIHTTDKQLRSVCRNELRFWSQGRRNYFFSTFKKSVSFVLGQRIIEFLDRMIIVFRS